MLLRSLPLTYDPFVIPKLASVGILSAVSLLLWAFGDVRRVRWRRSGFAALALISAAVLSTMFALDRPVAFFGKDAANGLVAYLAYGTVAFLILQLVDSAHRVRALTRVLVGSGVAVSVVSLFQAAVVGSDYLEELGIGAAGYLYGRGGGLFGNPDFLGTFLVVPFILALSLSLTEPRRVGRILAASAAAVLGAGLLVTQVRGAWAGVAAGLLVAGALAVRGRSITPRHAVTGVAIALAAVVAGVAIAQPGAIVRRVTTGLDAGLDAFSGGRISGWKDAAGVVVDRPVLGTGPDSYTFGWYRQAVALADPATGAASYFEDPHSFPIAIAATLGVPALLALLAMIGLGFNAGARNIRLTADSPGRRGIYVGWLGAFTGLLVASLFGVTTIPLTLLFFVCVAVLLTPGASGREVAPRLAPAVRLTGALVAAVCLAGAAVPVVADYHLGRFMRTRDAASLDRARAVAPWDKTIQLEYLGMRRVALTPLLSQGGAEALSAAEAFDAEVFRLADEHPHELLYTLERIDFLGQASGMLGPAVGEKSLAVINLALMDYPDLVDLRIHQARALNNLDRYGEAIAVLEPLPRSVLRDTALAESYLLSEDVAAGRQVIRRIAADYDGSRVAEAFLAQPSIAPYVEE
ncbi:MAG: O-antigen ligase family protein [Coriobacteriia bacterium]|nr:O-antigen ligase family protein [Coriobacteriia bacterium]